MTARPEVTVLSDGPLWEPETLAPDSGQPIPVEVDPRWHYGWMIPVVFVAGVLLAKWLVVPFVLALHGSVLS